MNYIIIRSLRGAAAVLCLTPLLTAATTLAQESVLEEEPIASDAVGLELPSGDAFESPEAIPSNASMVSEALERAPAFLRDASFAVRLRNFYFAQQDAADSPGNDKEKISWAQGGSLYLRSGKLFEVFDVTAEEFFSFRLYGPSDKGGGRILEPDQDSYAVLGVLNPRIEYEGSIVSAWRQRMDLPFVNSQENRMTPNTFESYSYAFIGEGAEPPVQLGGGYLAAVKKRDSTEFVSMSEGAGVEGHERGMPWFGIRVRPTPEIKIAAVDYHGIDFLNIFYSDAQYTMSFDRAWSLQSSIQCAAQRSVGDELLTTDSFSTFMWGIQEAVSFDSFMLRAAVTVNDKGAEMRSPYGSYPGYNGAIVDDFNQAGVTAWKIGLSYDFSGIGLHGLSAYTDFIRGSGAVNAEKESLPDKDEIDLNVDYRIREGSFKNLWLRLRSGFVQVEEIGTTRDFRIIVNYEFK